MLQVTQLGNSQVRTQIHSCLPGCEPALISHPYPLRCSPWTGVGGLGRTSQVRGTTCAEVWQGKGSMTNEAGVEGAEKWDEGWGCWTGTSGP